MDLVTADEMREMDQNTIQSFGLPGRVLMENAGRGATDFFRDCFFSKPRSQAGTWERDGSGRRVAVVAGRGNNGGDGFVMARYLAQTGEKVCVFLLGERDRVKGDAATNLGLLDPLPVPVIEVPDSRTLAEHKSAFIHQDIFIDAILGTGLTSEVKGFFAEVIELINSLGRPVFSVDIPSGLHTDTGHPQGVCVQATATATFAFAKPGHILYPGAKYVGALQVVDIGIPPHIVQLTPPRTHEVTRAMVKRELIRREPEAHKGNHGHLLIIAASPGKTGAAALAANAAMRIGTGLVTLGLPRDLNPVVEPMVLEAMTAPLPQNETGELDDSAFADISQRFAAHDCLALGPGIGSGPTTLVQQLLAESPLPMVIDADGLNALAADPTVLKRAQAPVVLTPHPGEMARLSGLSVPEVQADRLAAARNFARENRAIVVLKGARTVIAHPDGAAYINPTGNPGMGSGGMGDVLTGIIAGLICQGYPPETAARIGGYLHGAAADRLAARTPVGYLAGDLLEAVPRELGRIMKN